MPSRLIRPLVTRCARWASLLAILVGAALVATPAEPDAPPPAGILISVDTDGKVTVAAKTLDEVEANPPAHGLMIWSENEQVERWAPVKAGWKRPKPLEPGTVASSASEGTRGTAPGAGGVEFTQLTRQLPQLEVSGMARDVDSLLTPDDHGFTLNRKPTFRRPPQKDEPKYPAHDIEVRPQGKEEPRFAIAFAEGQDRVPFAKIKGLPKEYADGLPPGGYRTNASTFTIESDATQKKVLGPVNELAELLGNRHDPLYVQFTYERLVPQKKGKIDYLGDALDLLEDEKDLSPVLKPRIEQLRKALALPITERSTALIKSEPPGTKTGIAEIDSARGLMASSRWEQALAQLDKPTLRKKMAAEPRVAALALQYRASILGESGAAKADEAQTAFAEALTALKSAPAQDRYRAHVNYGLFLIRSSQDRLNNHAYQAAAGVRLPVLAALQAWLDARQQFETALTLTSDKAPDDKAAVQVNLARLYALLADIIVTLDAGEKPNFAAGNVAAAKEADRLAAEVGQTKGVDAPNRAVAEEIRALLAFRANDGAAAAAAANRALAAHMETGNLAGAEGVHRTLGLVAAQENTPEGRGKALRHLRIAHLITESLRERFPPDETGLTAAGFFARKAYVSQRIVELLLADGKADEALRYAEQGKARSLQDVLAANGNGFDEKSGADVVLDHWPAGTAAIEYFLGTEEGYVFVVNPQGKISAHKLIGPNKKPIEPRKLIANVRRILADMEGHSQKMLDRLLAKQGFDNQWQDDLNEMYQVLLPESARKELTGAKLLVIVPQHILHYFPFAALVTEKDPKPVKERLCRPRFLIEEGFDIVYAPSLAVWRPKAPAVITQVSAVGLVQAPGAPALEGVEKDLNNFKETFGKRVRTTLEGDDATEAGAKKLLKQPGMIFIGTHGLNDPDRPLESHLLLLGEENPKPGPDSNGGRLTAAEIYAVNMKAELVVMSCCYSGLGDRSPLPGDDLFGLQRAFLQGGARAVVSGQWDVCDRTAPDLMLAFFKKLTDGQGVATALNGAQRDFVTKLKESPKNQPWVHPYFWAVYTVAGDDRTRVK